MAQPTQPDYKEVTKESIRKARIEEIEKSIKGTELNISKSTADMAKSLKPLVEMLKNNLKEYKDENSQMIELMYQGEGGHFFLHLSLQHADRHHYCTT